LFFLLLYHNLSLLQQSPAADLHFLSAPAATERYCPIREDITEFFKNLDFPY